VLSDLLPAPVAVAERFDDSAEVALFPDEERAIARAVPKRRNEFATARLCARQALAELGVAPVPIVPGHRGAPAWPAGIVGSLTHCAGYRAAAVARATNVAALGIDAEPNAELPDDVANLVALPTELDRLAKLAASDPRVHWDRLLFSAKEAVYKAWFPLARRWLDFLEADLTFELDGRFIARLLVPGPRLGDRDITEFTGRWLAANGLVLSAVAVPA
jgi:4'-phosphopantetheinyl transferase EntD